MSTNEAKENQRCWAGVHQNLLSHSWLLSGVLVMEVWYGPWIWIRRYIRIYIYIYVFFIYLCMSIGVRLSRIDSSLAQHLAGLRGLSCTLLLKEKRGSMRLSLNRGKQYVWNIYLWVVAYHSYDCARTKLVYDTLTLRSSCFARFCNGGKIEAAKYCSPAPLREL